MADEQAMREFIENEGARPVDGITRKMLRALRRWHLQRSPWSHVRYAFFDNLAVTTGRSPQRMDAWAITQNAGVINGYELKASRSDAMHELHDLSKMQALLGLCHRAYMVIPAGPARLIVRPDELPVEMGLISIDLDDRGRLAFQKYASHRDIGEPTWEFVVALAMHKGGAT